jgi:hypothetical protein
VAKSCKVSRSGRLEWRERLGRSRGREARGWKLRGQGPGEEAKVPQSYGSGVAHGRLVMYCQLRRDTLDGPGQRPALDHLGLVGPELRSRQPSCRAGGRKARAGRMVPHGGAWWLGGWPVVFLGISCLWRLCFLVVMVEL